MMGVQGAVFVINIVTTGGMNLKWQCGVNLPLSVVQFYYVLIVYVKG